MTTDTDRIQISGWLSDLAAKRITRTQYDARIAALAFERSGGSKMAEKNALEELNALAETTKKGEGAVTKDAKNGKPLTADERRKANAQELAEGKITQAQYDTRMAAIDRKEKKNGNKAPHALKVIKPRDPKTGKIIQVKGTPASKAVVKGLKLDKLVDPKPKAKAQPKKEAKAKAPKNGTRHCPHCGAIVKRGERCAKRYEKGHRQLKWKGG